MGVYPQDAAIQIAKLGGQARVDLDHRQPPRCLVEEELQVEQATGEADGAQEAARDIRGPIDDLRRQAARQLPALEGLGPGVHDGVHHAEDMDLALVDEAVEVVLGPVHGLFEHQPVGAPGLGQEPPGDAVEGLDQAADDPQLPDPKARVGLQLVAAIDTPGQHREGRLHRFDEAGVTQPLGDRIAVGAGELGEAQVRLGADPLQDPAGVQLVLAGDDRLGRCPRQPRRLSDERRCQGPELVLMRDHARPAAAAGPARLGLGKAVEVEAEQAQVARGRRRDRTLRDRTGPRSPCSRAWATASKSWSNRRPTRGVDLMRGPCSNGPRWVVPGVGDRSSGAWWLRAGMHATMGARMG